MKHLLAQFEDHAIRRVCEEDTETRWFSVVDIMQVLTRRPDYQTARKYWNKLKEEQECQVHEAEASPTPQQRLIATLWDTAPSGQAWDCMCY